MTVMAEILMVITAYVVYSGIVFVIEISAVIYRAVLFHNSSYRTPFVRDIGRLNTHTYNHGHSNTVQYPVQCRKIILFVRCKWVYVVIMVRNFRVELTVV